MSSPVSMYIRRVCLLVRYSREVPLSIPCRIYRMSACLLVLDGNLPLSSLPISESECLLVLGAWPLSPLLMSLLLDS